MTEPVTLVIDNRLRLTREQLDDELAKAIRAAFTHANPKHHRSKAMGFYPSKKEPPTIETWRDEEGQLTLPRGGMQRLRKVLFEYRVPWRNVDRRTEGNGPRGLPPHRVELWDHQQELVDAMIRTESGVAHSPTASGKTTAAIALIARVQLTALVIVWSSNLLEQWIGRIEKELGLSRSDIGIIRGKRWDVRPITMAMQQTMNKGIPDNILQAFGIVICDEVQRFAASTFMQSVDKFPARYRFGISDDSRRKDGKTFLIKDMFGRVLHEVDRTTIEDAGLVMPVELRVIFTEFTSERYARQREIYNCAHDFGSDACRHCGLGKHERSQAPNFNDLLEDLTRNKERDQLIRAIAASEIVAGNQVLAFSHRVQHCLNLRGGFSDDGHLSGLLVGGDEYAHQFDTSKRGLLDGTINAAAGTIQAVGQGMDVPNLSRGILATPITDNKQMIRQVSGRISRRAKGKTDAILYVLLDAPFGPEVVKRYRRWYDRVMVYVDGDYATGRYVEAKQWLKDKAQMQLELTG